jgi:hypothetical protein
MVVDGDCADHHGDRWARPFDRMPVRSPSSAMTGSIQDSPATPACYLTRRAARDGRLLVSTLVNSVRNNGPELTAPIPLVTG